MATLSATSSEMPRISMIPSTTSDANVSSFEQIKTRTKQFLGTNKGTASVLVGLLVALAIFVFAHEKTYELTNQYLSPYLGKLVDDDKTPSNRGMLLHSVLGGLIVGLAVYFAFDQFLVSRQKWLA